MNLDYLAIQNGERAARWHPGFPDSQDWTGGDWANALAGETGEACNIVKKLRRLECGLKPMKKDGTKEERLKELGEEAADILLYLDLLCHIYGIHLSEEVKNKFNKVSELQGFPERL